MLYGWTFFWWKKGQLPIFFLFIKFPLHCKFPRLFVGYMCWFHLYISMESFFAKTMHYKKTVFGEPIFKEKISKSMFLCGTISNLCRYHDTSTLLLASVSSTNHAKKFLWNEWFSINSFLKKSLLLCGLSNLHQLVKVVITLTDNDSFIWWSGVAFTELRLQRGATHPAHSDIHILHSSVSRCWICFLQLQ